MDAPRVTEYRLRPGVRWVVERSALTLTDGQGRLLRVDYPEAAIWDLLSRGYSFAKVVVMTSHIAAVGVEVAEALVHGALERWAAGGFIERA